MKTTVFMQIGSEKAVDPTYGIYREALESIRHQTTPVQLVLFNAHRDEEAIEIGKQYADVIIDSQWFQNHAKINEGILQHATEYIVYFCPDDIMHPFYVEYGENILDRMPEYDAVQPDVQIFGLSERYWVEEGLCSSILTNNTMFCSALYRKTLFERLGGYEINMPIKGLEDWDLWLRAYKIGAKSYRANFPFYKYRDHHQNATKIFISPSGTTIVDWMRANGRFS